MFVSKSLDYAFRSLTFLADRSGEPQRVSHIARQLDVPQHYLSKILRQLGKAGIVQSEMGPGGGYTLCCAPAEVTVAAVYAAVEGQFQVVSCTDSPTDCAHADDCTHVPVWARVEAEIMGILDRTTLADFIPAYRGGFVALDEVS